MKMKIIISPRLFGLTEDDVRPFVNLSDAKDGVRESVVIKDKNVELMYEFYKDTLIVVAGDKEDVERTDQLPLEVSVSDKVLGEFTEEEVQEICSMTLEAVQKNNSLDGRDKIAISHYYESAKGRVSTFTTYLRGENSHMTIHVGFEDEIKYVQEKFTEMCDEYGADVKVCISPKLKAAKRRRAKRAQKRA